MFSFKPEYERSKQRMDAFWERELLDRPVVQFPLFKPMDEQIELPVSGHHYMEHEWLDTDFQAEWNLVNLSNQLFLGDTMPVAWPTLGSDMFAAFYGCPLYYGEFGISWSEPIILNIAEQEKFPFDWTNPNLARLIRLTDTILDIGKGKFITGMPDWHTGGDCIAALRGSIGLAADLINNPAEVIKLLCRIEKDYEHLYRMFFEKLRNAGQPISTWVPLVSDRKYSMVSNDFSTMISASMYRDIFLDGVIHECQFLDRSLYHLDGPGALRHLDAILDIAELDGVQFVPSPWDDSFMHWAGIYKRIQKAGKCIQVNCKLSEIEDVIRILNPAGLYLYVQDVTSEEIARELIHTLERWCLRTHSN
jgi:hypothetical protein